MLRDAGVSRSRLRDICQTGVSQLWQWPVISVLSVPSRHEPPGADGQARHVA